MVDPKMLELTVYEDIPHQLVPVVTDPKKAAAALFWAMDEMDRRYRLMREKAVRNIDGYNRMIEKESGKQKETLIQSDRRGADGRTAGDRRQIGERRAWCTAICRASSSLSTNWPTS